MRILTWLLFYLQTYFYFLIKKKEYGEEVLIVTNPILPFLGTSFFPKRKIKFKVLVYDVYPDALSNFGYIKKIHSHTSIGIE